MNKKTHAGSPHGGIGHWRSQRLSAVLLLPLTTWLLWAVTQLAGADYAAALGFFSSAWQKGFTMALIGLAAFHAQIGIQVVCEDYLYPPWLQSMAIWLTRTGVTAGFLLTVYALLTLPAGT